MKVVVGLGNPGKRYDGTRHNVGFAVIDSLAASPKADRFQSRFQAQVCELIEDAGKILLVKPETFMNLSGCSVRQVVDFYRLPLTELLIVCDDINLPLGKLRVRAKGTHGGHNGLRDIQNHLGTTEYARLRIGVGAPNDDAIDHVLGRFGPADRSKIADAIALAAQAVIVWASWGVEVCMNQYNAPKEV
jgi:PTH1 family peptidyl-tRNA hydrolase